MLMAEGGFCLFFSYLYQIFLAKPAPTKFNNSKSGFCHFFCHLYQIFLAKPAPTNF